MKAHSRKVTVAKHTWCRCGHLKSSHAFDGCIKCHCEQYILDDDLANSRKAAGNDSNLLRGSKPVFVSSSAALEKPLKEKIVSFWVDAQYPEKYVDMFYAEDVYKAVKKHEDDFWFALHNIYQPDQRKLFEEIWKVYLKINKLDFGEVK